MTPTDAHLRAVARALTRGNVVPLLGAGANLCDRPPEAGWSPGSSFLPSGAELARHLADDYGYPFDDGSDLLRVSEYVDLSSGEGSLYDSLRDVFTPEYEPTGLHRLLARLPGASPEAKHLLVVTTNYDDLMERAFAEAGEPCDVVVYQAIGRHRGRFVHHAAGGEPTVIDRPNEYRALSLEHGSVVLKIHGAVDPRREEGDSFVVTEDHYIEYLAHASPARLIPVLLLERLLRSHFLFLGYRLRDWNLRALLHEIWGERDLAYRSWAIQVDPDPLDCELWRRRGVEVHDVPLDAYVRELGRSLGIA